MKPLQLGINYGMGVPSLARGLDRHPLIASDIIERHQRTYPRFWQWRENMVQAAMLERRIESVFGWPLRISTSPNKRTLYNFPMQSGGAEMLRLAAWRLCEAGIVPIMLVHDGILLEETDAEQIEHAKEIMRAAGRDVCDGFEIGVDVDQMLDRRRALPRQAAGGAEDVGDDHGRARGDRRPAAEGVGMTRVVKAHGQLHRGRGARHRRQAEQAPAPRARRCSSRCRCDWWRREQERSGRARLVLILLLHMAWKAHSSTFACPNGLMERCGISRKRNIERWRNWRPRASSPSSDSRVARLS